MIVISTNNKRIALQNNSFKEWSTVECMACDCTKSTTRHANNKRIALEMALKSGPPFNA